MGDARDARYGWRTYKEVAEADVSTPATGGHAMFWDSADSKLKQKKDDGTVADVVVTDTTGLEEGFGGFFPEPAQDDVIALRAKCDMTITEAGVLASESTTVQFDVRVDVRANHPPDAADSIVASAPPALSAASESLDTTLTGWTTAITKGDIIIIVITSITGTPDWVQCQIGATRA